MSEELASHKIKLEQVNFFFVVFAYNGFFQVEVALAADPTNEDLLKLKADLEEIIKVTQELFQFTTTADSSASGSSRSAELSNHKWKVGERCMAKSKNGQKLIAIIDGITEDKVAVTFASSCF